MKIQKISCLVFLILAAAFFVQAQTKPKEIVLKTASNPLKSSPAYAELLLQKTERESQLEELLIDKTEEYPKVREIRFEMNLIQKALDKMLAVNASDSGKLTLALGKLMSRKIETDIDLWNLKKQYSDDHPEVKRAKRKMEVFDKAIKEILP